MLEVVWKSFFYQSAPLLLLFDVALLVIVIAPFLKNDHPFAYILTLLATLVSLKLAWQHWGTVQAHTTLLMTFDPFSYLFLILLLIALLLTLLISRNYLKNFGIHRPEYYGLLLFALFGMGGMVFGGDLMVIFLSLEIMSVAVYVLAGFQRSSRFSVEAALKYFLMGAFASAFLLLGIAFIYGVAKTTQLSEVANLGPVLLAEPNRPWTFLGIGLVMVGFAFKLGVVPFHMWVPDVYQGAPVVVTSFMATAVKIAGFGALLRLIHVLAPLDPHLFAMIIAGASALTMTVGNIAALRQKDVKRMLAFSSIAHAGYALMPLVGYAHQPAAVLSSVSFYLLTYLLMTMGAFAVLVWLTGSAPTGRERTHLDDFRGLATQKPWIGFCMTVLLLSLAGLPPTMGFFGKYYLFVQVIKSNFIWLAIIGVINSVISFYYYLAPVVAMYFSKESEEPVANTSSPLSLSVWGVIWATTLSVLCLGGFPSSLFEILQQTFQSVK